MIVYKFADYKCSYWNGSMPAPGDLYLTLHHLLFQSFIMGKEEKIKIKWIDITVSNLTLHFRLFFLV